MARSRGRGIEFDNPNGEEEKFHAKESWIPVVLGMIPIVLVGVIGLVVAICVFNNPTVGWILLGVCTLVAFLSRVPRIIANLDTDVVVSNKRLYVRTGIIDIKDQVCDLANISDVTVDPTIFGRIFNYADVRIQTFAGDQDFLLKGIADAYGMRRTISQISDELRSNGGTPNGASRYRA